MGILSWLFPSPEQKLANARVELERGRFADARALAQDANLPESAEVIDLATQGLCRLNIAHAQSWAEADEPEKVHAHLELAHQFVTPATASELAEATRAADRTLARKAAEKRAAAEAVKAGWHEVDERFFGANGGAPLPMPVAASQEEAELLYAQLSLVYENYPESLRPGMIRLGTDFADALLALEENDAPRALSILQHLPEDEPLVHHERARASLMLQDNQGAATGWRRFAELTGGHAHVGNQHTGVLLATCLVRLGDLRTAEDVLVAARKEDVALGGGLLAQLLEARGDYGGAESVLRDLLQRTGPQPIAYTMLGRVRAKAGKRLEAMATMESGLKACGCGTGKCGTFPPDLALYRGLATLYLEDGNDPARGIELALQAKEMIEQPQWEDLYLATLLARAQGDDQWPRMAEALRRHTPPGDPREATMAKYLPAA